MKHALKDMTFAEFRERLPSDPVILIPLGSHEQHGPHAPMGDHVLSEAIALRVAEASGAVVAPVVPFGHADFFRPFPGGIQLRAATFLALLEDVLTAFLDHGLRRLLILNGHSSNAPLIEQVARRLRRERGVAIASIDLWRSIPDGLWVRLHGRDAARARGHGGDPVTSVAMHFVPHLMRLDLAQDARPREAMGLPVAGVMGVVFEGAPIALPLDAHEVSPEGMMGGDPSLSSAEIGREIVEHLTGFCARFVAHLRACDPADPLRAPALGAGAA